MTSENSEQEKNKEEIKEESSERSPPKKPQQKTPKRVAAGKKGVEARKLKNELKRKEAEKLKKENIELKQAGEIQITKHRETKDSFHHQCPTNGYNLNKNYIPLCLSIVVIGLGLFFFITKVIYQKKSLEKSC